MSQYRPERRNIPVRILTTAGWLSGTFHLPARSRLVEQLNRPAMFIRLTDVTLHARGTTLPFLALHRNEMILVVPPEDETGLQHEAESEPHVSHEISCLLDLGMVTATVRTLKGLRMSDFFVNRQGFVLLDDATLHAGGWDGRPAFETRLARVVVNASRVLGISDAFDPAGGADGE